MALNIKKDINFEILSRLTKIFIQKKWEINTSEKDEISLFNRFCAMLRRHDLDKQKLILDLTENYFICNVNKYDNMIKKSIEKIEVEILKKCKTIYILPLVSPKDIGKSKSSTMVAYLLTATELKHIPQIGDRKLKLIHKPEEVSAVKEDEGSMLMLVDDFIGTGKTAQDAIEYLLDKANIDKDRVIVLSLVSQCEGAERIKDLGVRHYSAIEINKGISDQYLSPLKEEKIKMMRAIESKIGVKKNFSLGYGESEALVTLVKTPNNTFPVFWLENTINKEKFLAPFPRN